MPDPTIMCPDTHIWYGRIVGLMHQIPSQLLFSIVTGLRLASLGINSCSRTSFSMRSTHRAAWACRASTEAHTTTAAVLLVPKLAGLKLVWVCAITSVDIASETAPGSLKTCLLPGATTRSSSQNDNHEADSSPYYIGLEVYGVMENLHLAEIDFP